MVESGISRFEAQAFEQAGLGLSGRFGWLLLLAIQIFDYLLRVYSK